MNLQERIDRLESLLERVRANAKKPRAAGARDAAPSAPAASSAAEAPADVSSTGGTGWTVPPVYDLPSEPAQVEPLQAALPPVREVLVEEERVTGRPEAAEAAPEIAIEAPDESAPLVELSEEEIVEIDVDDISAAEEAEEPDALDAVEPPPPSSSRRPRLAASSMDEALASAAAQLEEEREPPLKTPPPESGRQIAAPAAYAPEPLSSTAAADAAAGAFEAEAPRSEPVRHRVELHDDLGPSPELHGPPSRESGRAPAVRELALESQPAAALPPEPAHAGTAFESTRPELDVEAPVTQLSVIERPPVEASAPVAVVLAAAAPKPSTFLELLDSSLGLGRSSERRP